MSKRSTGKIGELIALEHLRRNKHIILNQNYKNRCGEIDIITRKGSCLVFIEVKTRTGLKYGSPLESIDKSKIARIRKTAGYYMSGKKFSELDVRFDVITVIIGKVILEKISGIGNVLQIKPVLNAPGFKNFIKIMHIENAF